MSDLVDSLSRNLRGYWCPMLQYGGLTLQDQTRFKNHGTLTNMDASTDWVMSRVRGRSGRVLDFDGTNDHVNLGSSVLFHPVSFSVGGWCKLNTTAIQFQRFISSRNGGNSDGYIISFTSGAPRFLVGNGTAFVTATANPDVATDTKWHHYLGTYSSGTSRFYVDGILQNSASVTVQHSNTTVLLGSDPSLNVVTPTFLNGQIAKAGIWNRALSPGEIQELYRIGPGWYQPQLPRRIPYSEQQAAGFKAYWARRQSQLIGGGV